MLRNAAALALVLTLGLSGVARAGVYGDDLAKCLVKSTAPADQTAFMVWLFAAMGAHPAVKVYSSMTDAQRTAATRQAALLMQRLLTVDCRKESVAEIKYEGQEGLGQAFSLLGQVAMRGLMGDPAVASNLESLGTFVDKGSIESLSAEAGVAKPAAPAAK
jgi:hypothetical protein